MNNATINKQLKTILSKYINRSAVRESIKVELIEFTNKVKKKTFMQGYNKGKKNG